MNRLQKKCFVVSAGIHLLLGLILFIGPGFISSRSKQVDDLPILNFVPVKTVDDLVAPGGGNPKAPPPVSAPQPAPPQSLPQPSPEPPPQVQPQKSRDPDPPKEIKPVKTNEESLETVKEGKPRKIEINTKLVTRQKDSSPDKAAHEEAQAREEAKAQADARRRLARQLGKVAERIGNDVSGVTTMELQGPGGGGLPYANWKQAVKSVYDNAWVLPDGVLDDGATTVASVTIARDGKVVCGHITRFSGDSAVDRSVQATLDRVNYAAPLPDNAKEDQRTVTILFNVRAKRSLG
jgi:outer membrane biosynthesis protein TonB